MKIKTSLRLARLLDISNGSGRPNAFQSVMEQVLDSLIWKTTVPYLDDCNIVFFQCRKTLPKTKSSPRKISFCEFENKTDRTRLFPNLCPFTGSYYQQILIGGRSHQNCRREKVSHSNKFDRSKVFPRPMFLLPSLR